MYFYWSVPLITIHRWVPIWTLRPLHSVRTPNISQVWVFIVKRWVWAFIWYARLSIQNRIGSDGWLRVPLKEQISCASVGADLNLEAPWLGELALHISQVWMFIVKDKAKALIWYACLSIQSRFGSKSWLRVQTSVSISCSSVGDDFDFEAP